MTTNHETLREEILQRSVAKTWSEALSEWSLTSIEFAPPDEPEVCLCGHQPIIELCYLRNKHNGVEVLVGNVCVQKFMGIPSEALFRGAKRITLDAEKATPQEVIDYAYRQRWINDWERGFCESVLRRRALSMAQLEKRMQINRKIAARLARS